MRLLVPPRLCPGDRVRVVSPSSPPSHEGVERGIELLTGWGLRVELGEHVFDQVGYLAGTDADRAADLNSAFRDPGVRAIFAARGGKGASRIVDDIDFTTAARDPKPLVGFSDITCLHLALWRRCGLVGLAGPFVNWSDAYTGPAAAEALRRAVMTTDPITIRRNSDELTAPLSRGGTAAGFLMGGNLTLIRGEIGAQLPSFAGAILIIEATKGSGLGQVDGELTQLIRSGSLTGLRGIAVGQFTGFEQSIAGGWTIVDVLRDRLTELNVPILGGLPFGHGLNPALPTYPVGMPATIDPTSGTLTVQAGVR